jgi:hypothetical protein
MTKHHILYPLLGLVIVGLGIALFLGYRKQWQAGKDEAVQEARQQAVEHEKKAIEIQRQADVSAIDQELNKPATIQTVTKYIKVPGQFVITQPAGQPAKIEINGDPQQNLNAFQDYARICEECKVNLEAARATAVKDQQTIDSQRKEIVDLQKLAVAHWTLTAGLTKAREGAYKPAAFVDYRATKDWGVTLGAANNAVFGGVSWRFGKTPGTIK